MSGNAKTKVGVAAGLLVLAAAILAYSYSGPEVPPDFDQTSFWYCTNCKAGFEIKGNAPEGTFKDVQPSAPADGELRANRRGILQTERLAKCPKCGQHSGHAGRKCGVCQTAFRLYTPDGRPMICPNCKWDPLTGREAEGSRLDVLDE